MVNTKFGSYTRIEENFENLGIEWKITEWLLRCTYTYESGSARVPMSQTRLCGGRHEPGSAQSGLARRAFGGARLAIGSYVCGWSRSRLGTMSASMSKTFMSPDFLTKILEEYRELPVLWQVRSADNSNRAKRDEAWDLLV
jgi:hypothetical protein